MTTKILPMAKKVTDKETTFYIVRSCAFSFTKANMLRVFANNFKMTAKFSQCD